MNNTHAKSGNRSAFSQMCVLIVRQLYILKSNIKKLLMITLLPVITAVIVGAVSGDKMYAYMEDTKSTLFTIVCVSVWIGLFNSIQEICQERGILKREYMANLNLFSYIMSKFAVQAILCFLQSIIFFLISCIFIDFPDKGLVTGSGKLDIFISLFLIMLASDAMGLLISSLVKSGDIANIIAPVVLILQLVMSGVLFKLEGFSEYISYATVSKWGMESLGSVSKLNSMDSNIMEGKTDMEIQSLKSLIKVEKDHCFDATNEHMVKTWLILMTFSVVLMLLAALVLTRISKDSR